MNAPEQLDALLTLTREPFPASRKAYIEGTQAGLRVPHREVTLTNGEVVSLYDTSGPYTDPSAAIDVTRGLPDLRTPWIEARGDSERYAGRGHQVLDAHHQGHALAAARPAQPAVVAACGRGAGGRHRRHPVGRAGAASRRLRGGWCLCGARPGR